MEISVKFMQFSCKYDGKLVYNLYNLAVNMMEISVKFV